MEPLVSIIVPVYNTKKNCLNNCMNSLIKQIYTNIEILIIDDGSEDDIKLFCDKLVEKDIRIKVHHQENKGVSIARNFGTQVARGEYIMYVDSDDVLAPIAVKEGINHIIKDNVDFVLGGMEIISTYDSFSNSSVEAEKYDIIPREKFYELKRHYIALNNPKYLAFNQKGYINRGPYCRLIKKSIAISNPFPEGVPIGEDLIWNMNLIDSCESICVVYNNWYGYIKLDDSAVRKYYGNRIEQVEKYIKLLFKKHNTFCKQNMDVFAKNLSTEFYCILRYELLSSDCKMNSFEKNKIVKKMLHSEPWRILLEKKYIKKLPQKQKILLLLCRINLWQIGLKVFMGRGK